MKITPNSLTVNQLLSETNEQYVIPPYQRRYSWERKQVTDFIDDIRLLDETDSHLLGSIVCLAGPHTAGINTLELVDGQQRLTTIAIILHCLQERTLADGKHKESNDILNLLYATAYGQEARPKVSLDSLDSDLFRRLSKGDQGDAPTNERLAAAFATCRDWIATQGTEDACRFLARLRSQAIVVRLEVSNAKDAFKLFETINNRGLRLSPPDIIKNFILGNAARFGETELDLARIAWAEILGHLDGLSAENFFRHYLVAKLCRRITASFVIQNFKRIFMTTVTEAHSLPERAWYPDENGGEEDEETSVDEDVTVDDESFSSLSEITFEQLLDSLTATAKCYREILLGATANAEVNRRLRNLRLINATQAYPFLVALRMGKCNELDFLRVLKLTEGFMLRRHICREKSNENETIFAGLCATDPQNPACSVLATYAIHSPSDERFLTDFAECRYSPGIMDRARYCLEQFEQERLGQTAELSVNTADLVHVEHIIPQKIVTAKAKKEFGDWQEYLGAGSESLHTKYVGRIGNLTLFAGKLNIAASNNPYEAKKVEYRKSALRLTNGIPTDFPEFRFSSVEERSKAFAESALILWPYPNAN